MKKNYFILFALSILSIYGKAISASIDSIFPVRGLCLEAPSPQGVDSMVTFIDKELAPQKINTLILRVDYRYRFETHPELIDTLPLSKADIKKIVFVCKKNNIRLIPQINLLGHQSWESHLGKLLAAYPQFDETPHVQLPQKYEWPNADGLYCKSYCPNHPDVHKVIFEVMDELCDVFETNAFHAGMDEVFYIGNDKCPRCQGLDKAELFASEVRRIYDHLAKNKRQLMIWGDRLLEGRISGLGMWEGSYNNTHRAIDMIPKDVFICDWHYERPDKTAVLFATKGFQVVTCPWRNQNVTKQQIEDVALFRRDATPQVKNNYAGIIQTVWSPVNIFIREAYRTKNDHDFKEMSQWKSFIEMCNMMNSISKPKQVK